MRRSWDDRVAEDAVYFLDSRSACGPPDLNRFWADGEHDVDKLEDALRVTVGPAKEVLEIGSGAGRLTRVLTARAPAWLRSTSPRGCWSLTAATTSSTSLALRSPLATSNRFDGCCAAGWAVFQISKNPAIHRLWPAPRCPATAVSARRSSEPDGQG
jgi:hypothetical protein